MSDEKNHDYHLVDPSPWPFIMAWSAFIMAAGFIFYMHQDSFEGVVLLGSGLLPLIGLTLVCGIAFFWWRDVVNEAEHGGHHTPVVQLHMRYGMFMFIASELMFFVAWFWVYFDASLFPFDEFNIARGNYTMGLEMDALVPATEGVWPPVMVETFDPWDLPFINTLVLLLSGFSVTWAHHALIHDNRRDLILGLAGAVILGLLFTALQAYEYSHAAFAFDSGLYASAFYMATGFHGFHVIIGTIMLFVMLVRAIKGHFKPDHHFGFEAAAWYWHFVDVVWIFLFIFIYVLGQ